MVGGSLSNHVNNWREITDNVTVLEWLEKGVPLDFISEPNNFQNINNIFSPKEDVFLKQEIQRLEEAKCIKKVSYKPHCISRIGTVPKKDGSLRLITDLRDVNKHLQDKNVIYEGIDVALDFIEPDDQLITLDIKDGFYHVQIDPKFQKYLGIVYRGEYYVWCVLPFGLKHSSYFFCKILRPVIQYLRQLGLKIVSYVDDFLVADKRDKIFVAKNILLNTLKALGYIINTKKSVLTPDVSAKFIGYEINTSKYVDTVYLQIPKDRIKRLKIEIKRTLKLGYCQARGLARITGQIISMCKVFLPAKLLLRNLYRLLSLKKTWQEKLMLDQASREDLIWWLEALNGWNGKHLKKMQENTIQITTDASGYSWGGSIVGEPAQKAQGYWDFHTQFLSSNTKEILAVLLTLKSLCPLLKNKSVQILTDNITTCAFINMQGGSVKTLDIVAKNIWDLSIRNNIKLQARYLAGRLNTEADTLSRLPGHHEWYIHPRLFNFLDSTFGPHDIDRFASILTTQLPRYNSRFWDPQTEAVDALAQDDWATSQNFVNPPFRLLSKVIQKIINSKATATVIAPWWPAQPWFKTLQKMAVYAPIKLPQANRVCIPVTQYKPEPLKNYKWDIYAWKVSGSNI